MLESNTEQNTNITGETAAAETTDNSELVIYGTKEVAKMFRCSIPTAREIMRREGFPLLVFGGKWMVERDALKKWVSEKRI